jgi:hypothetical protein
MGHPRAHAETHGHAKMEASASRPSGGIPRTKSRA